jgi:hypothetical protein
MATLTPQLFAGEETGEDEEQLLKLFWNRAELKKELAKLRNDVYQLNDELKREQAIKLRIQQRLEQLETLLANPATSASAVTFYQLREVWARCRDYLKSVSDELEKACADKGYRQHVAAFQRKIYVSLEGVQGELEALNETNERKIAAIKELREKRGRSHGIWNFFRRRKITAEIRSQRAELSDAKVRAAELAANIETRSSVEPPEYPGLAKSAKRSVNLVVIAYAQEFYLHLMDRDIAEQAREAEIRQVTDIRYGDKRDCRALSRFAAESLAALTADKNLQLRAQLRAQYLGKIITYRSEVDTIPASESLESIAVLKNNGSPRGTIVVNVLANEYWDIYESLLA